VSENNLLRSGLTYASKDSTNGVTGAVALWGIGEAGLAAVERQT
jgi:hypothetical protein